MGRDYGYTSLNSSVLDYFDIGDFVEDYFGDIIYISYLDFRGPSSEPCQITVERIS